MNFHKFFIPVILILSANSIWSQGLATTVPVIGMKDLQLLLEKKDDTIRLFNFWATWCRPCVKELPYFEELNSEWKKSKAMVYLISLDFNEGQNRKLHKFLEKNQIKSQVLLFDGGDPNKWIDEISREWSGTIPASLVVQQGRKCFLESSFDNTQEIRKFINSCSKSN
ncbi:MAG: TlpA family protein disulfide reductase [Saprospiraceae bacterium]|nr:TlpA family protein disulfide reductase [Saprospiraceae bacterium]